MNLFITITSTKSKDYIKSVKRVQILFVCFADDKIMITESLSNANKN